MHSNDSYQALDLETGAECNVSWIPELESRTGYIFQTALNSVGNRLIMCNREHMDKETDSHWCVAATRRTQGWVNLPARIT